MKPVRRTARVTTDFTTLADYPISHDKIALFNSGLVTLLAYQRDRGYFVRAGAEHLRIDLGWGAEWMPWQEEVVTIDDDGAPSFAFEETDAIARFLTEVGVRPHWSYSYVPQAARPAGGDWRTMAEGDQIWVDTVASYVAGARERGVEIGYHEIYNEPDLRDERTQEPVFYAGDLQDYLDLYRRASRAIRAADPDARIGGPALASVNANSHWLRAFLKVVTTESLPLDFLSFHHYGTYGIGPVLRTVRDIVSEFPQLSQLEIQLNEYNSFTIDYPRGGLQDTFLLASAFAADVERFLATPWLTSVSWAQFLDSGNDNYSGMVTDTGHAKPLFRAYEHIQTMPIDRRRVEISGPEGIGALASSDGTRRSLLVWNRSITDVELDLDLGHATERANVTLIDSRNDDAWHPLTELGTFRLERGAVVLVEGGTPPSPRTEPRRRVVLRPRYDIADRSSTAWTHIDEETATIRFGTAGEHAATLRVGMDLPADHAGQVEAVVTYADGTPAPGTVSIDETTFDGVPTIWATLTDAPANVFARVDLT
ncbi:GH39 family glycosyl hydrolase [Pseudactinotalea terrae]|uniref:GH39 family glycosyl hydrolase n=1 Tax=Pseudactinotalea terrae TaxID=1743262 RepID=UPI0012E10B38|nr:hypothetical protein [Pseudactinotalea terrae]